MPRLIALDKDHQTHWEKEVAPGTWSLGRLQSESSWATPWDNLISKKHADLAWRDGRLHVARLESGRNPIIFQGHDIQKLATFSLAPGEKFQIGDTTFELVAGTQTPHEPPIPTLEASLGSAELDEVRYGNADERIEVLEALPRVIRNAPSDDAMEAEVLGVLLRRIPAATAVAVVQLNADDGDVRPRSGKGRGESTEPPRVSRSLVTSAVRRERRSVLRLWELGVVDPDFTSAPGYDWAFCVPMLDDASPGMALYVVGHTEQTREALSGLVPPPQLQDQRQRLQGDVKFAGLVVEIFGALRQVNSLRRREEKLIRFFSEPVRAALAGCDVDEVLAPRQAEVTVLFCDLRGSVQVADGCRDDLARLWDRIGEALDIMTEAITDQGGVIGDFQGDAAMGFWGWPLESDDRVERAVRAALNIRRGFKRATIKNRAASGLKCGVGIATGPAYAGRLGTFDQAKISVFGPRVNLASRLESLTKIFSIPILIDDETARLLESRRYNLWARIRRVATIRPVGMSEALPVSELLPPATDSESITESHRAHYEAALDAFNNGDWDSARNLLGQLVGDGPAAFLLKQMAAQGNKPPGVWDGVVTMTSK